MLPTAKHMPKMEARFYPAIWLGKDNSTNENILGISSKVVKARTIRRQIKPDKYNKQLMDIINSSPAMIPPTTPSIVVLPQTAAAKQQTTTSTQTQQSPQPKASVQSHTTTPPALTDLPMATAPATQQAKQALPMPTQGKREVTDEITQVSSPKQARTTERATAASRPDTAQEPPTTRMRISQVTVTTKKGQKIEATSNEDEQEIQAEKILLEPWVNNTEGLDKERNETRNQVNEGTRCIYRSTHQPTHPRTTQEDHQVKMGSSTERQHSSSTNCSKGLHRGDQWQRRHLRVNTNLLRSEDATRLSTLQQLDLPHRRHLNSLSTCRSSNSRSLYVSTSRVLQRLRSNRLATQQSHLWLTQQPKSMAKSPGWGDATTWTTTTCQRAQRLRNITGRCIHTMLRRRLALHRTTGDGQQAVQEHPATPPTPSDRRTHSRQHHQLSGQKHLQQGWLLWDQSRGQLHDRAVRRSQHAQLQSSTSTRH